LEKSVPHGRNGAISAVGEANVGVLPSSVSSLVTLAVRSIADNIEYWGEFLTPFHIRECLYILSPFHEHYLPDHLTQEIIDALAIRKKISLPILCLFLHSSLQFLSFAKCGPLMTDKLLKSVAKRAPNVVNLDTSSCTKISNASVVSIVTRMHGLQSVNFSGCHKLTNVMVAQLALSCGSVKSLNLSGLNKITDQAIFAIANHMSGIEELDLSSCSKITEKSMAELLAVCENLKVLKLEGVWEVGDGAILNLKEGNKLQTLDLSATFITDQSLWHIRKVCSQLKHLLLEGCSISDEAFTNTSFIQHQQVSHNEDRQEEDNNNNNNGIGISFGLHLETLKLGGCSITDRGLLALFGRENSCNNNCGCGPALKVLYMPQGITDEALLGISEHLPCLEELVLDGCTKITDRAFMTPRPSKKSEFSSSSSDEDDDEQEEEKARYYKFPLPKLKRLSCRGCKNLTSLAVECISKGDCGTIIENLCLRDCPKITDRALIALGSARCLALTNVDLTGCVRVSSNGIEALLKRVPVRRLVIEGCHSVSLLQYKEMQKRFQKTTNMIWR
jgi:hypothetical protein